MRQVVLVTAHFPPSNLVGVHRARTWAQHLPEYGWSPTIVTAHWSHYQEALDWELVKLLPDDLRVIRTNALGLGFARLLGNMALRALWWTRKEMIRLAERNEVDFMHIIVPDHYSALLGPLLHKSHNVPYGIDYMDPWVLDSPEKKTFPSKAWASGVLSSHLEPWSLKSARLVTGVSASTYEGAIGRSSISRGDVVTAEIPMASSKADFRALSKGYRPSVRLFEPGDGKIHIVYAGTIPARFHDSLQCFLAGLRAAIDRDPVASNLRVWLLGTGTSTHGSARNRVTEAIREHHLSDVVSEYPERVGYLDALWHQKNASAVLLLGSSEAHYTPSKVYQATHTGNPVLALIPENGSAADVLRASGAGMIVNYPDERGCVVDAIHRALSRLESGGLASRDDDTGDDDSGFLRVATRRLAQSLDRACER